MRTEHEAVVEILEARMLLAGNVTVEVVGGTIEINGDNRGNDLIIDTRGLGGGQLRLSAENTTINGQFGPVEFSGVTGDIEVALGEGKDRLKLQEVNWPREVRISSDSGDDYIQIEQSTLGELVLESRDGDDTINFVDTNVSGAVLVRTSDGGDVVTFGGGEFQEEVVIETGRGNDTVFHDSTFAGGRRIVDGPGNDVVSRDSIEKVFNFHKGRRGWRGAFADVFRNPDVSQELDWGLRRLPGEIGSGRGMFITSENSTDDVFMYLTRQIGREEGLRPRTTYQVRYDIRFASNAPINCGGIGGQPGESVYLKAGATPTRPRARVDDQGIMRLNVDHGQQAQSGKAASVVGHIGNGQDCPENPTYVSLRRRHIHTALVKTDSQGRLHLIVGTDSGYEGTTSLYYQRIGVKLIEVAKQA